jgi:hypothetical protein
MLNVTMLTDYKLSGLSTHNVHGTHLSSFVARMVMSELAEFFGLSNQLELCSDYFPSQLCQPGGINKDPTVW